jgi:holin-like protein
MAAHMDAAVANISPRFSFSSFGRRLLTPVLQIAAIIGLWWIADTIVRRVNLPIPGGVAGLFLLWGLLGTGILPVRWVRGGAKHLLDHLLLFFVPPMLALLNHPELLGWMGLKLLLAILVGVPLVMTGTALVVEIGFRWSARHES